LKADVPPDEDIEVQGALTLPPVPVSAREARRFVSQFCTAADMPDDICETAALLTSELVTNAVLHGRSRATLHVRKPPPYLRVSVEDHNPELPEVGDRPALSATSGRGLHIVAELASRWGIERSENGKRI
jgi:anti-sigma regulatory factor (Ser/Thr protein kinase)